MSKFKTNAELARENCGGMDKIDNPHNFSSNPGFMSTEGMLGASTPVDGGVIRGTSARGSLPTRPGTGPARPISGFNGR